MSSFTKGDIVTRRSHKMDVVFKVVELFKGNDDREYALLRGIDYRLICDAPVEDLVPMKAEEIADYWRRFFSKSNDLVGRSLTRRVSNCRAVRGRSSVESFGVPGTVLHIDGDRDYLDLCLTTYKQLGVVANGYFVPEEEHGKVLTDLLSKHLPDILVITGHDGLMNENRDFKSIGSYRHSGHFVAAVRNARAFEHDRDSLVIFAGACQSHYEALLAAGANFASSPQRVLIHAFDPVFIVEQVAYTPVIQPVSLQKAIEHTITGYPGIGGVQTQGRFRLGVPRSPY